MEGVIVNYRMGRQTQNPKHMIIRVEGVDSKEAAQKLKGKKVVWETPSGKKLEGEIAGSHGNKGAVRVRFEKGLPGQSIGTKVSVK